MKRQPMQPIVMDSGVVHFQENAIVRFLVDWARERGMSLNELALMPFRDDDRMQLAQLIGYSVSGFGDLSYARRDVVDAADALADKLLMRHKRAARKKVSK